MLLARAFGNAVATVKHSSLTGWKLLLVQPLGIRQEPDGDPLLVIDTLGAGKGALVMISNEGSAARKMVGSATSPVRWFVLGIVDE